MYTLPIMKNLFDRANAAEIADRVRRVGPDAQRQWGKMTQAQMLAHCANGLEMALGEKTPPRLFIGRLLGGLVKKKVLRDETPFGRNSPTDPILMITDERELDTERQRLLSLVDRFSSGGPAVATKHPHSFFGRLTPDEWAVLMYKHLDHHLRQFGV
jgi:hypothetical protein